MNNDAPLLDSVPKAVHSDNLMEFVNNHIVSKVNFLIDRYNGVELPKTDVVSEYAAANSIGHLPRAVQEAAYNAANPNAPAPTVTMDPVEQYAAAKGMAHLSRPVQEAAYAAANPQPPLLSAEA